MPGDIPTKEEFDAAQHIVKMYEHLCPKSVMDDDVIVFFHDEMLVSDQNSYKRSKEIIHDYKKAYWDKGCASFEKKKEQTQQIKIKTDAKKKALFRNRYRDALEQGSSDAIALLDGEVERMPKSRRPEYYEIIRECKQDHQREIYGQYQKGRQ